MIIPVGCGTTQKLTHDDKQEIVQRGLDKLGLDVEVEIVDLIPDNYQVLSNYKLRGLVSASGRGKYRMKIYPYLNNYETTKVIAHELIHVDQYVSGGLKMVSPRKVRFRNRIVDIEKTPYNKRPWELDAERRGRKLERYLQNGED